MSMTSMWETFREAGPVAWVIVPSGVLGALGAVAALILGAFRAREAFRLGMMVAGVGILCAGLGGAGVAQGRMVTDRKIAAAGLSEGQAEMVRHAGFREARSAAGIGLMFAALPLLAGITVMFAGRRRWEAEAEGREGEAAPGVRVPVAMAGLGVVSAGFALAALSAPLPERHPVDGDTARFAGVIDEVQHAQGTERLLITCAGLERDLVHEPRRPPAALPAAARKCVEGLVAAAVVNSSLWEVRRALQAIRRSALVRRFPELGGPVQADLDEVELLIEEAKKRPGELTRPSDGRALMMEDLR